MTERRQRSSKPATVKRPPVLPVAAAIAAVSRRRAFQTCLRELLLIQGSCCLCAEDRAVTARAWHADSDVPPRCARWLQAVFTNFGFHYPLTVALLQMAFIAPVSYLVARPQLNIALVRQLAPLAMVNVMNVVCGLIGETRNVALPAACTAAQRCLAHTGRPGGPLQPLTLDQGVAGLFDIMPATRPCCHPAYSAPRHPQIATRGAGTAGLNVPMFIALRRFTLLFTILLERYWLKKTHDWPTLSAMGIMIGGELQLPLAAAAAAPLC